MKSMLLSAPTGNHQMTEIVSAREFGGPHAIGVGGAEPWAERR
ncbi:MAG: hypothetical protein JWN27_4562 [Candidatus Eremiobacteraeota bacterium]|nr:hypothetical protein [Candidatus Eremiobacteraeota bacterium]